MKVVIEINIDNAAFEDDPIAEVLRIIRESERITDLPYEKRVPLFDINGNKVGYAGTED